MQAWSATLTSAAAIGLYVYAFGRVVCNPLVIELRDTKEHVFRYDLDSGTFWDRADVRMLKRTDQSPLSSQRHTTIRRIKIEHTELDD